MSSDRLTRDDIAAATLIEAVDGPRLSIPVALIRRLGGDLGAAAFLAQAAFLTSLSVKNNPGKDGWFDLKKEGEPVFRKAGGTERQDLFSYLGSWEAALGIGVEAQVVVRRRLRGLGLLEEQRRDVPARLHYRVRLGAYLKFLGGGAMAQMQEKPPSRCRKSRHLDAGKSSIKTQEFGATIPESFPESSPKRERTRAREVSEVNAPPQGTAAAPQGGGGKAKSAPETQGDGIWFRPGDPRDEAALARIRGFEPGAVAAAVARISATEPTAWPGQVLAALLKARTGTGGSRPEHLPVPPPVDLTRAQIDATAAARAAAGEKLEKLKKKMVVGK